MGSMYDYDDDLSRYWDDDLRRSFPEHDEEEEEDETDPQESEG